MDARLNTYVDRLYNEWVAYGKIVLGVDYDNTISPYHTFNNSEDIERTINLLKVCKQTGCYIVIHTACRPDRYEDIKTYCKSINLSIDTINETPIDIPYGKSGSKPYCNHYLDDRAALPIALDILETALYKMRGNQQSKYIIDVA